MIRVQEVDRALLAALVREGKSRRASTPTSACPSKEMLLAFVSDHAQPEERAAIESHIETCSRCSDEVAWFHDELDELLHTPYGQQELLRLRQGLSAPSVRSLDASFEPVRETIYRERLVAKGMDPEPLAHGRSEDGVTVWTMHTVQTNRPLARRSWEWKIHFKSQAPLCFTVTAAGERKHVQLQPFSPMEFHGDVSVPAGAVPTFEPLEPEGD